MRARRWRTPEILRARAIELGTRPRPETLILTASRAELRARPILRAALIIHPIPRGRGTTVGAGAIEARALRGRWHRWTHFIFAAAEILHFAARRKAVVIHHAALMPAHPIATPTHPRIAVIRTNALLHPRRRHGHSRSPVLLLKARTLLAATPIPLRRRRTIASRLLRTLALRALIFTMKLPVARTCVAWLRWTIRPVRIGAARPVFAWRRAWRALGCVVLRAERPRGKRERGGGHEDRSWFHSAMVFGKSVAVAAHGFTGINAAPPGFCAGRICQSLRARL